MKFFLTAIFATAFTASFTYADDQKTTAQAPAVEKGQLVVKAPFKNHWDAAAWEANNDNFWKSTGEQTAKPVIELSKVKEAKENSKG